MKKPTKIAHRGHLRNLIKKGLIEARCKYRYTDDYAYDSASNYGKTGWKKAYLKSQISEDTQVDGIIFDDSGDCYDDFKTSTGGLWKNGNGEYSFLIHSNLSYSIRFIEEVKNEL